MSDKFNERVEQYVRLRDGIKEIEKRHKEELRPFKEMQDQLKEVLLSMLNQSGQESARTDAGTAYRSLKRSATIADGDAFRRFVIAHQAYELLDWRANAPAVSDWVKEHNVAPPGINFTTFFDVGVRRPNGKGNDNE